MKLYYSGNSPYARRPRMAIRQFDLMDRVEEVDAAPLAAPDNVLKSYGPGGKVPGLLTDSGAFLCETLIILNYLDEVSGGRLYPAAGEQRDFAFQIEGVASLLMEALYYRAHENRREASEQSPGFIANEAGRAARCYDAFEGLVDQFVEPVNMAHLSVVASLGYADWRHPGDEWRGNRPKLAGWFDAMMEQPASAETKPIF
jgi:glutathione S-transferase